MVSSMHCDFARTVHMRSRLVEQNSVCRTPGITMTPYADGVTLFKVMSHSLVTAEKGVSKRGYQVERDPIAQKNGMS